MEFQPEPNPDAITSSTLPGKRPGDLGLEDQVMSNGSQIQRKTAESRTEKKKKNNTPAGGRHFSLPEIEVGGA